MSLSVQSFSNENAQSFVPHPLLGEEKAYSFVQKALSYIEGCHFLGLGAYTLYSGFAISHIEKFVVASSVYGIGKILLSHLGSKAVFNGNEYSNPTLKKICIVFLAEDLKNYPLHNTLDVEELSKTHSIYLFDLENVERVKSVIEKIKIDNLDQMIDLVIVNGHGTPDQLEMSKERLSFCSKKLIENKIKDGCKKAGRFFSQKEEDFVKEKAAEIFNDNVEGFKMFSGLPKGATVVYYSCNTGAGCMKGKKDWGIAARTAKYNPHLRIIAPKITVFQQGFKLKRMEDGSLNFDFDRSKWQQFFNMFLLTRLVYGLSEKLFGKEDVVRVFHPTSV